MQHYCCYTFWLPETQDTRIVKIAKFFPSHCTMPTINEGNAIMLTEEDVVDVLGSPKRTKIANLFSLNYRELADLDSVFDQAMATRITKKKYTLQRMQNKSSTPT